MHGLDRRTGLTLTLFLAGILAPQGALAQAAPEAYPAQPGYPQYQQQPQAQPQQYPQPQPGQAQAQQYPQQYQQPQQPYQYPQQYPQPQPGQAQPYPQQYQQPQPGQAQPYPQQYQQPEAYPQQYQQPGAYPQAGQPQGYPQQYPQPQAYPRQPGYYQQPAYPAAPVASAPVERPRHRGFMALPYLGLNFPVGDGSDYYSTGFRMGALLGGYLGSHFSLNGELSIDFLNPDTSVDVTNVLLNIGLSPLFHFGPPRLDIVFGPRLGYFVDSMSYSGGSQDITQSVKGFAYGFNTGAFFQLGRIWLGGLLSLTLHDPSEYCVSDYSTGYDEECRDADGDAFKLMTLNGAILF
jgi:hypothetical protein